MFCWAKSGCALVPVFVNFRNHAEDHLQDLRRRIRLFLLVQIDRRQVLVLRVFKGTGLEVEWVCAFPVVLEPVVKLGLVVNHAQGADTRGPVLVVELGGPALVE